MSFTCCQRQNAQLWVTVRVARWGVHPQVLTRQSIARQSALLCPIVSIPGTRAPRTREHCTLYPTASHKSLPHQPRSLWRKPYGETLTLPLPLALPTKKLRRARWQRGRAGGDVVFELRAHDGRDNQARLLGRHDPRGHGEQLRRGRRRQQARLARQELGSDVHPRGGVLHHEPPQLRVSQAGRRQHLHRVRPGGWVCRG